MTKIQAFLGQGLSPMLNGSPARGAEQWHSIKHDGSELEVHLSGSGPYVLFQGPIASPILPPVDLSIFRCYLISIDLCSSGAPEAKEYVYNTASASLNSTIWEIHCTELFDGQELVRQMKMGVAHSTNLPMKQAVAVATRRKRRPLNPQPYCRRCKRPAYECCSTASGGRHYRLKGDR